MKSYGLDEVAYEGYQSFLKGVLEGRLEKCPYRDPDTTEDYNLDFYGKIKDFLEKQEKNKNQGFSYNEPEKVEEGKDGFDKKHKKDYAKITVLKNGAPQFLLTSDQLGFSALCLGGAQSLSAWDDRYPYAAYLRKSTEDVETKINFVADCVRDTRTIGGSFLFPTNRTYANGEWKGYRTCQYNLNRGVRSYIEDRADFTLLEIKNYLDCGDKEKYRDWIEKNDVHYQVLYSQIINEKSSMRNWLGHFETFKDYVEFFCFQDFCIEEKNSKGETVYYPIDVISSKVAEDTSKEKLVPLTYENQGKKIEELDGTALKTMLNNVRHMTLARSRRMTGIIGDIGT